MKARISLPVSIIGFFVVMLILGPVVGHAQTPAGGGDSLTTEATRMDRMTGTLGEAKVTDKLAAEFSSFLGADAKAVVTGLRNGTPIVLTTTTTTTSSTPGTTPTTTTTTTTVTPPTGKMGFGNVFITLASAKQELSQLGITQPTPQQLQAALTGGTITSGTGTTATSTNLQGILTLRSQHMGWGQIAQKLGFKLGSVVSGLKSANHGLATGAASAGGAGIVNAAGRPVVGSSESGRIEGRSDRGGRGRIEVGDRIEGGFGQSVRSEGGITTGRGHSLGISGSGAVSVGAGRGHTR